MVPIHRGSQGTPRPNALQLLLRVARGEGWRGVTARLLDRRAAAARRGRFVSRTLQELPHGDLPAALIEALNRSPVRVLNVLPTEPRPDLGGVQTQFRLRLQAELRERTAAVLFPGSNGFRLEIDAGRFAPAAPSARLARLAVEFPPDLAFDVVLTRALELTRAQILHVEQPLGLKWTALGQAARPLVLSLHDFGLFCSRPHLLERPGPAFCGFCRDDIRCAACLRHDPNAQPDSQPGDQAARRQQAGELLRHARAVVFPSAYLRDAYCDLFGTLPAERQHVVSPPSVARADHTCTTASAKRDDRPLRVAFVGSFKPHKGSRVFLELLDLMGADTDIHWHVLGGGDAGDLAALRSRPRVKVHGYYRSGHLTERLRSLGIDLALILSIWPETYCMTLDECLRAGVPVLAFDHGAPGERLGHLGGGLLVDPAAGPSGIEDVLRRVLSGAEPLPSVGNTAELPDAVQAAAAFRSIYETL